MAARLPILQVPTIAQPCHQSWEQMPGTARVRHCAACNQPVVNLAAMSAAEITNLLAGPIPCLRIARHQDGSLVTTEPRSLSSVPRLAAGLLTAAMAFSGAAAQISPQNGVTMGTPPAVPPAPQVVGHITDHAGHPLADATATLLRQGKVISVARHVKGDFVLSAPAGHYDLLIEAPRSAPRTIAVELSAQKPVALPVALEPARMTMGKMLVTQGMVARPK